MRPRERQKLGWCAEPDCGSVSAVGKEHCLLHDEIHRTLRALTLLTEEARLTRRHLRQTEKRSKELRQRLRDLGVDNV